MIMFYISKAVLNIRRFRVKSVLTLSVCAVLVLFLFLFIGNFQTNRNQLAALPDAMPVYAQISNLNGTARNGILISDARIRGLENSPHVTELSYTVQVCAASKRIARDDVQNLKSGELNFPLALGINSLSAYAGLSEDDVTFIDGFGSDVFDSADAVCIVRDTELGNFDLKTGDSVWFTLFYLTYPNDSPAYECKWLGEYEIKIAGSFSDSRNDESDNSQIVFPAKWLRKLHEDEGVMFNASSASFRVNNPLMLNDFKTEMKNNMLMSVISHANYSQRGIALSVNDQTFIRAASRLMDNIALMKAFTPLMFAAVGLVGFVVSYLLLHGRRPEIAIMRSLGMNERKCFTLLFMENSILSILGSILGIILAALISGVSAALAILVVVLFYICYMAGTVAALALLSKLSVMAVLAALD